MKYQNLHTHTIASDGKLSYLQTLDVCEKNNISIVAFTDHDSLPNEQAVSQLKNYPGPVRWITGIEISSGLPRELGGKPTSGFHIVGLFIDPFNKQLQEYCQKMQAARVERMEQMVRNLRSLGFKISIDDCLDQSKGETVNRPHIVAALKARSENIAIIDQLKQKYPLVNGQSENQQIYSLFLDKDSFIPNIYVDYLYGLELDKTVEIIRQAGGLAFLAHWTFCKKLVGIDLVEKLIKQKRLDGVEVVYNPNKKYGIEQEILTDVEKMKSLAKKHNCLQSGGVDSHNEQELKEFFQDKNLAQQTIGLAEKIIDQSKITLDKTRTSMVG